MKKRAAAWAMGFGLAAATLAVGAAPASADVNADLAAARAATAAYHDEDMAAADGYIPDHEFCVESPEGAMGYHDVNPANFEGPLDVRKPQAVLYQPGADGSRKLVAVEYIVVDADQNTETDDDRPYLFGQPFDGPMEGHGPGMPVHYDLHVWIWQHNPAGMFAAWNPAGSC